VSEMLLIIFFQSLTVVRSVTVFFGSIYVLLTFCTFTLSSTTMTYLCAQLNYCDCGKVLFDCRKLVPGFSRVCESPRICKILFSKPGKSLKIVQILRSSYTRNTWKPLPW